MGKQSYKIKTVPRTAIKYCVRKNILIQFETTPEKVKPLFINDKLEFDGITTALSHWQSYPRFWRWYQF